MRVRTRLASPPPEPGPGVWSVVAPVGVSLQFPPEDKDAAVLRERLWVLPSRLTPPPEPSPGVWDIWLGGVSTPGTLVALDGKWRADSMVGLLEPINPSTGLIALEHVPCTFKGSPCSLLVWAEPRCLRRSLFAELDKRLVRRRYSCCRTVILASASSVPIAARR